MRPGSHRATDHHRAGSWGWRGCSRSAEGRRRASNRYRVGRASIFFPRGVARRRQARRQSLPFERPPTAGYVGRNWVSLNPAGLTPLSSHVRKPMQRSKNGHLWLADLPADHKRLGIGPVEVAEFEDRQRIDTDRGRYEWRYFHAHLDDGVVVFSKPSPVSAPVVPRTTDIHRHRSSRRPNRRQSSGRRTRAVRRIEVRL